MILILEDDGCLHVYDDVESAIRSIEAVDVEETARAVFDELGTPYRIEWLRPNTGGRTLGVAPWVASGEYTLRPAGSPRRDQLLRIAAEAARIIPENKMDEVRAALARLSVAEAD